MSDVGEYAESKQFAQSQATIRYSFDELESVKIKVAHDGPPIGSNVHFVISQRVDSASFGSDETPTNIHVTDESASKSNNTTPKSIVPLLPETPTSSRKIVSVSQYKRVQTASLSKAPTPRSSGYSSYNRRFGSSDFYRKDYQDSSQPLWMDSLDDPSADASLSLEEISKLTLKIDTERSSQNQSGHANSSSSHHNDLSLGPSKVDATFTVSSSLEASDSVRDIPSFQTYSSSVLDTDEVADGDYGGSRLLRLVKSQNRSDSFSAQPRHDTRELNPSNNDQQQEFLSSDPSRVLSNHGQDVYSSFMRPEESWTANVHKQNRQQSQFPLDHMVNQHNPRAETYFDPTHNTPGFQSVSSYGDTGGTIDSHFTFSQQSGIRSASFHHASKGNGIPAFNSVSHAAFFPPEMAPLDSQAHPYMPPSFSDGYYHRATTNLHASGPMHPSVAMADPDMNRIHYGASLSYLPPDSSFLQTQNPHIQSSLTGVLMNPAGFSGPGGHGHHEMRSQEFPPNYLSDFTTQQRHPPVNHMQNPQLLYQLPPQSHAFPQLHAQQLYRQPSPQIYSNPNIPGAAPHSHRATHSVDAPYPFPYPYPQDANAVAHLQSQGEGVVGVDLLSQFFSNDQQTAASQQKTVPTGILTMEEIENQILSKASRA